MKYQKIPLESVCPPEGNHIFYALAERYSWIPFAAAFPAPIARITVAAPVTASPPAYTPSLEVAPVSSVATIHFLRFVSSPAVVEEISGFGEVPSDMITVSQSISYSEPSISTGLLLPDSSGAPSSILIRRTPFTQPLSSTRISVGF